MTTPLPPQRPARGPGDASPRERDQQQLSQDRTHLAAERTYASWMRTGLSIAAGGIAIVRLLPEPSRRSQLVLVIGGAFVLLGVAILTWGARQFTLTVRRLREGRHPEPTTPRAAWLLTTGLGILLVAVLAYLVMHPPGDAAGAGDESPAPATTPG